MLPKRTVIHIDQEMYEELEKLAKFDERRPTDVIKRLIKMAPKLSKDFPLRDLRERLIHVLYAESNDQHINYLFSKLEYCIARLSKDSSREDSDFVAAKETTAAFKDTFDLFKKWSIERVDQCLEEFINENERPSQFESLDMPLEDVSVAASYAPQKRIVGPVESPKTVRSLRVKGEIPTERKRRLAYNKIFRVPILRILHELGGGAQAKEVLEKIEDMEMRDSDKEKLDIGGNQKPRWYKAASWERYQMCREGLLVSPRHGWWQLSEKGKEEARKADPLPKSIEDLEGVDSQ